MEFVSVVVGGNDVQEQDVLSFVVQAAQSELHLGEHLPGRKTGSSGVVRGQDKDSYGGRLRS